MDRVENFFLFNMEVESRQGMLKTLLKVRKTGGRFSGEAGRLKMRPLRGLF